MVFKTRENDEPKNERRKKREKTFNESFSCLKMIDDLQLVFGRMDGNILLNGLYG
jgi:hypothetical protein